MPHRGRVHAAFILKELKCQSKGKKLFHIFDLEKTFYRVLQKVIWYALRKKVVPQYLVLSIVSYDAF